MPHIIVKLWPGQPASAKQRLADAIVRDVEQALGLGDESVSVGFEEVSPQDWTCEVYAPDIAARWGSLLKTPGYGPGPSR